VRSKPSIRKEFKSIRESLKADPSLQANALLQLQKLILELLKEDTIISAYYPIGAEPDVLPLLNLCHERHIPCALPRIKPDKSLEFLLYSSNTPTRKNSFGIPEPYDSDIVSPTIIIVPLLACDLKGNRLGYGLGHYDRYLSKARKTNKSLITIGLCYEDQIYQGDLPKEPHDQKLDFIVTDRRICRPYSTSTSQKK
jgi:5-formyltetrahydrofolate cyclo-ligase